MKYKSEVLSPVYWELEIDLVEDYKDISYKILTDKGYENVDHDIADLQYFDIANKTVKAIPRKTAFSKQFVCPKGYENALNQFEKMIINGKDLTPHMSKKLYFADEKDKLFYDWGIHHFHLTSQYNPDGMAKRSDYLIFAYITNDTFYFIQTYKHKEKYVFSKQEMIRIIDANWPKLLDLYRIRNASLTQSISDSEYNALRDANVCTFVEIDGNQLITSVGGGYMSNGVSGRALRTSDHWKRVFIDLQSLIVKNAEIILNTVNEYISGNGYIMSIKLLYYKGDKHFTLIETVSNTVLIVDLESGKISLYKPNEIFNFNLEHSFIGASISLKTE